MHTERLFAAAVILPFVACGYDADVSLAAGIKKTAPYTRAHVGSTAPHGNVLALDMVQRTCALYVAVRSSAWQGPVAFGRELDDSMIHWNKCPGGSMVACADVPTANGDTIRTGIPFPH